MKYQLRLLIAVILMFSGFGVYAQSPDAKTENMISPGALEKPFWRAKNKLAKFDSVTVEGQPFAKAFRIEIPEKPQSQWDAEIKLKIDRGVSSGDAIVVKFYGRTIAAENEAGEAFVATAIQHNAPNWEQAVSLDFSIPRKWTQMIAGEIVRNNLADGSAEVTLQLGRYKQTLEIANIEVINMGKNVKPEALPYSKLTYDGRSLDAPWRTGAEARIENIRKGDLVVKVIDRNGNNLSGVTVTAKMKKHAFKFGTCVNAQMLGDPKQTRFSENDVLKYREWLQKLFNCVVIENHLKPTAWDTQKQVALNALEWLRQNGFAIRGHAAVWPSERFFAPSWKALIGNQNGKKFKDKNDLLAAVGPDKVEKLDTEVNRHVAEVLGATKDYCFQWDVINEPYTNHTLMDIYGNQVMVKWFKTAKAAAPKVSLFINDYGIVQDAKHAAHYQKTIKYLLDNGAPLDGIGEQGHYGQQPPGILQVLKTFDMLGQFKLPLVCTEFDVNTRDPELQADYTRDYITAVFSHPAMEGFLFWGFWSGAHWLPNCGMLRKDWSEKPNLHAYSDLIFKKWWTDVTGETNADGEFSARGFLGDYEITATVNGKSKTVKAILKKPGTNVEITL